VKKLDLTGQVFGRLTALEIAYCSQKGAHWLCQCKCGGTAIAPAAMLKFGQARGCGCYQGRPSPESLPVPRDLRPKLKGCYSNMLRRCTNPASALWPSYGGRGISVCAEWLGQDGRKSFYDWAMDNGFAKDLSLDRIDNSQGYSPDNCRWTNHKTQMNNTRRNRMVEWEGQLLTLSAVAHIFGVPSYMIRYRLNDGWAMDRIYRWAKRQA
jgi:hypothetical protein